LGSLQILYSGKAHPADDPAKEKIRQVIEFARQLNSVELKIVYLENYDWSLGAMLTFHLDGRLKRLRNASLIDLSGIFSVVSRLKIGADDCSR
jgi:hypothetical protein